MISLLQLHWADHPNWEKATIGLFLLAGVVEIAAFIWSFVVLCSCCCKKYLVHPLPVTATIAFLATLVVWVVFMINMKQNVSWVSVPTSLGQLNAEPAAGYSLWLTVGADALLLIATVIGVIVVKLTDVPLL